MNFKATIILSITMNTFSEESLLVNSVNLGCTENLKMRISDNSSHVMVDTRFISIGPQ